MADQSRPRRGAWLALGLVSGVAATAALLAARTRIYHFGNCPECGASLVVSYEPTDTEPCIRREDTVEHDPRIAPVVQRAREHSRRPCRTVVIIT